MDAAMTKQAIDDMMEAMRSAPTQRHDAIFISAYVSDAMKAEIDVLNRFAGRDWRRIKRERRKAQDAVKSKHHNKPQMGFAVTPPLALFNMEE